MVGAIAAVLVNGILSGALYALLGISILVLYRTTQVANFAQADMGTLSAFLFLMVLAPVLTGAGVPVWAGWCVAVLLGGLVGGAGYFLLMWVRADADPLDQTIRTFGLYTMISAVLVFAWGEHEPYRFPSLFRGSPIEVAGIALSFDQVATIVAASLLIGGFFVLFNRSSVGLKLRAVAIDRRVASFLGIDPVRAAFAVWVVAGAVGAAVGLFAASAAFLDTALLRPYLFKAFTAAILGGLHSFPGLVVGALLLGVLESFAASYLSPAAREPLVFFVLLMVLLVRPDGLFGKAALNRV
jgi:branched-chain amino acid transport system permease protein